MRSGLLLIAAMVAGSNSPARGAVPDWVEALKSVPTPAYEPGVQGVCLLNEAVIQVTAAGEIKETRRTAYKILGRQGLSLAWVQLSYDGDTKASGIKGWNVKADGVVHEVGSRDAIESHFAGGGGILFDDVKKLLLPVPQAEIGSLIAFEYEKKHRPLILQDAFQIQGLYPVMELRGQDCEPRVRRAEAGFEEALGVAVHPCTGGSHRRGYATAGQAGSGALAQFRAGFRAGSPWPRFRILGPVGGMVPRSFHAAGGGIIRTHRPGAPDQRPDPRCGVRSKGDSVCRDGVGNRRIPTSCVGKHPAKQVRRLQRQGDYFPNADGAAGLGSQLCPDSR